MPQKPLGYLCDSNNLKPNHRRSWVKLEDQRIFSDNINVWQAGTITVIPDAVGFPLIGGLAWSPTGWRVRPGVG